jgi:hypothetical protein
VVGQVYEVEVEAERFGDADVDDAADVAVHDEEGVGGVGECVVAAAVVDPHAEQVFERCAVEFLRAQGEPKGVDVVVPGGIEDVAGGEHFVDRLQDAHELTALWVGTSHGRVVGDVPFDGGDDRVEQNIFRGGDRRDLRLQVQRPMRERVKLARGLLLPFESGASLVGIEERKAALRRPGARPREGGPFRNARTPPGDDRGHHADEQPTAHSSPHALGRAESFGIASWHCPR